MTSLSRIFKPFGSRQPDSDTKSRLDPNGKFPSTQAAVLDIYKDLYMYNAYMENEDYGISLRTADKLRQALTTVSEGPATKWGIVTKSAERVSLKALDLAFTTSHRTQGDVMLLSFNAQKLLKERGKSGRIANEATENKRKADVKWKIDETMALSMARPSIIKVPNFMLAQNFSKTIEEFRNRLVEVLKNPEMCRRLQSCRDAKTQPLLDTLQIILYSADNDSVLRRNLIIAIRKISKRTTIFPTPFYIDYLDHVNETDVPERGANGYIYRGIYQERAVCVKVLYCNGAQNPTEIIPKILAREAVLWGQLEHPNLLPFYGVYLHRSKLSLVSPWADNGTLRSFINKEQEENRSLSGTRLLLCSDIVAGIRYLHENDMMHGDLKGDNILIDKNHRAYLADFGHASVDQQDLENWSEHPSSTGAIGTLGYHGREHLEKYLRNTKESDIFAFGMVCWEVFTGLLPFSGCGKIEVVIRIQAGEMPLLESINDPDLTPDLRQLIRDCWKDTPESRPNIQDIAKRLAMAPMLPKKDRRARGEWQDKSIRASLRERVKSKKIPLTHAMLDEILGIQSSTAA